MDACQSLVLQKMKDFFFFVPTTYWNGTEVSSEDLAGINTVVNRLKRMKMHVHFERVETPQKKKGHYLEAETEIRNYSMDVMKRAGVEHALILDADEIWRRSALQRLDMFLDKGNPKAVCMKSVPIIGFPGYPVGSIGDGLEVYIKTSEKFLAGRTPEITAADMNLPGIFHFTSTRRSMEDTVRKHIQSSHYGDKLYDFDKWVRDVLPTLKPGVKDCHMFTLWQIWPEVRHFTRQEWVEIPKHLKQYLGKPE
jgi:hypothetical protein